MSRMTRGSAASGLDERLVALGEAVDLAQGRLDPATVDSAAQVVARAGARLGLGVSTTVVALAGATGSGKSTLFNAVVGEEVSTPGVRRPTTGVAHAAVWPSEEDGPATALLDWLEVGRRHEVGAAAPAAQRFEGLVLLDLPDYDSVRLEHRAEVDRLVALVDLLVWVVDPQKYADAALHERYLVPLAGHAAVMLVVLNQVDRLSSSAADEAASDLQRLLAAEGLRQVPVLTTSARTGEGLDALLHVLDERVAARRSVSARLTADVAQVAEHLARAGARSEGSAGPGVQERDADALVDAMADAAGARTVTEAVAAAHRRAGSRATGWPFTRWRSRLRPDPLRRLHLSGRPATAQAELVVARTSLPAAGAAELARLRTATTALARRCADGLPEPWPELVQGRAQAAEPTLPALLDRAVGAAPVGTGRRPGWWRAAGGLQWLLAVAVLTGAGWLALRALAAGFQLGFVVPIAHWGRLPVPTALVVVGVVLGLALAAGARLANRAGASRRALAARRTLRAAVAQVAATTVLDPVGDELAAHAALVSAVGRARGSAAGEVGRRARR